MLAIYRKELMGYVNSAIGYIFMATFLIVTGIFFSLYNLLQGSANFSSTLQSITIIFLFLVPILTMKIISEETKNKTDQLLLTSPLKISHIILGKYLAALTVFVATLVITILYPILLSGFGTVSVSEIFTSYVGILLLGASLIAIGLFVSSLTENQISAAVITFGILLFIWMIDGIKQNLPSSRTSNVVFILIFILILAAILYFVTKNIFMAAGIGLIGIIAVAAIFLIKNTLFDGLIAKIFDWFSLLSRYDTFSQGVFDLSTIVYYLSICGVFIFLTIRIVEKRRWS